MAAHGVPHRAETAGVEPGVGSLVLDVLGGPHLVLADAGHVDALRTGELADPVDDVLRLQAVGVVGVAEREGLLPVLGGLAPVAVVGVAQALLGEQRDEVADDLLGVADDRDVGDPVLGDLGRVDVGVDDLGPGRERRQRPVTRSSNRAPMVMSRSDFCRAVTAATVPCIPGIPRFRGCESGTAPRAMSVVTTGIWARSTSRRISSLAPLRITPPPT